MVATAYYRFEAGVIKRSSGHSAVAKAAYNAGVKIYDQRLGETFNFTRKQDVYGSKILASANAPEWVYDRSELWNRIEAAEKRKDSQVARHFVLSLPNFMSDGEKVAVTKSFLHQECVWRGMVADIAWHDFDGKNRHNPHAHVMLSMRVLDRDGFGKKNRDWNQKSLLLSWRSKWAEHLNRHLAKGGYQQRVDHRSYQDRGIDQIPTVHEGATHSALRRDGIQTHLTAHNDNIHQQNQEREQIAKLEAELAELKQLQRQSQHPKTKSKSLKATDSNRPRDPTEYAVRRQLKALGGNGQFEVGILDPQSSKMLQRNWHRDAILRYDSQLKNYPIINYLKHQNSRGKHIYVRPAPLANGDTQGLVLIDDLDGIQVEELKERGLKPACTIETSYRNHQVWLKVSNSLQRDEATAIAKILTKECDGDAASASYQHYGRLAGFTNRKDKYADKYTGQFPWVRIVEATGASTATTAKAYLHRARQQAALDAQRLQQAQQNQTRLFQQQSTPEECQKALKSFERIRSSSSKRFQQYDDSRLDWVTLKRMAKRGYSVAALKHALLNGSPNLEQRKRKHVSGYIDRTVAKVFRAPDVIEALERRSQRSKDRSHPKRERLDKSSHSASPEKLSRQAERKSYDLSDKGIADPMIRREDIFIYPLGSLDKESVAWLVDRSLKNETALKQFKNARWTSTEDTRFWQDQCRAEYLKELGRYLEVKGSEGYTPYTDVEIATKLRMAGFGRKRIYQMLRNNSPFVSYLDPDARTRYIVKGIRPLVENYPVREHLKQWQQERVSQAIAMPENKREAFLKEHRLDKLNLSLTKERWSQQKHLATLSSTLDPERDR